MGRIFNLVLLGVMIAGAIITYDMKYRAGKAAHEVARLHSEIDQEKEEIALLRAELSMLMQPGRIQQVVEQHAEYFGLVPFSTSQIASIEEIPLRAPASDDDSRQALMRLAVGAAPKVSR
jgi:hypothetical protein